MDVVEIGEPVKVDVIFETLPCLKNAKGMVFPHHKIKPQSFSWRGREYRVREITYVWREAIGDALVYHFAVTEGDNIFELCFNNSTMEWALANVARE
jgi:hypothetical protein